MSADKAPASSSQRLQQMIERLVDPCKLKKVPLTSDEVLWLIRSAKKTYQSNPQTLLQIDPPLAIGGDTHGQYRDVLRFMHLYGWPPQKSYLFLGDYVDRGPRSIEVVCLMFAMKLAFPNNFHLLRGNHEAAEINRFYGFYNEIEERFETCSSLFAAFNEAFAWMPLAALVGKRILCMHGGIPEKLVQLDQFDEIQLPIVSPKTNDLVADLLWSDPSDDVEGWCDNPRGLGHQFGQTAFKQFVQRLQIETVVRAHQVFNEGYKVMWDNCVTVVQRAELRG